MSDLKFYIVSTAYLDHLQAAEPKVYYSKGGAYINAKPYVGVVLEVAGHNFVAPLTSYKPKQDTIKSSNFSVFKLHERGNPNNKLGMISLNNMIPVLDSEITLLDMAAQSAGYRRMLYKQLEFIKTNSGEIKDRAAKLHHQVTVVRTPFYLKISCDFNAMIDASREFKGQSLLTKRSRAQLSKPLVCASSASFQAAYIPKNLDCRLPVFMDSTEVERRLIREALFGEGMDGEPDPFAAPSGECLNVVHARQQTRRGLNS